MSIEDEVRGGDGYLSQISTELLGFAPADPLCELAGVLAEGATFVGVKSLRVVTLRAESSAASAFQ